MSFISRIKSFFESEPEVVSERVVKVQEASSSQGADEPGWRRLTGDGLASYNDRDLMPMQQDRMQRLAEYLWQSNLLANRLVEIPLAYLLAEGVQLECGDEDHNKLLQAFWNDPINNFPLKLEARIRALSLLGEQCYTLHVNEANGFLRLGYLDPRQIAHVILDPDNTEQPIGVVTKKDARGKAYKYKVAILGEETCFSSRTQAIRTSDFADGQCLLFQVNKLPNGSRGRSDLLAQMDWLDAYDSFLFGEIDRVDFLKRFVWDVTLNGADDTAVKAFEKNFKAPAPNSTFVHNDSVKLEAKSPQLNAAETNESARLLRNHVLGGGTMPEHWFGGGGDVNRASASEMGEPTFKVYTARQSAIKLMLQTMGRIVLMNQISSGAEVDWSDPKWQVNVRFPELVNKDITKFAAAMQSVTAAALQVVEAGLLSEERALQLIADVAGRFGQEIDAAQELLKAKKEKAQRQASDAFNLPADESAAAAQLKPANPNPQSPRNP